MQIYLAGYYSGRAGLAKTDSLHLRVSQLAYRYPHILESFYYMGKKPQVAKNIRTHRNKIFLDSGAFSAFTQGVKIDLKKYGQFIKENADIVHTVANLDCIGAGQEQVSYSNQKQLEALGIKALPVHHVRDHDDWLRRYLDEGYDHIGLGGMVGVKAATLIKWLDHVWLKFLTNPDGSPKVKVHGFGMTRLPLMFRYPWASVDSTSWVTLSRNGGIYLDLPQPDDRIKDVKIEFSRRSFKRRDPESNHFDCLRTAERKVVVDRLEELEAARFKHPEEAELQKVSTFQMGLNPEALAESYGWRDIANIEYFRRVMNRSTKTSSATRSLQVVKYAKERIAQARRPFYAI